MTTDTEADRTAMRERLLEARPELDPHNAIAAVNRFLSFVQVRSAGCWTWLGCTDLDGYGRFGVAGKTVLAHRVSYEMHNGKIPTNMCVLHRCDNPGCVNPAHLWSGTYLDNAQDRENKNRGAYGEKHWQAKLTEEQVREIRRSSKPQGAIAKRFGIDQAHVSRIKNRRKWKHIK